MVIGTTPPQATVSRLPPPAFWTAGWILNRPDWPAELVAPALFPTPALSIVPARARRLIRTDRTWVRALLFPFGKQTAPYIGAAAPPPPMHELNAGLGTPAPV